MRGLRRGRTVNRQDAVHPTGAKKSGVRRDRAGPGDGFLSSWPWRLGVLAVHVGRHSRVGRPQPRQPPAEPATGRLSRWCARLYDRAPELMAPPRPTGGITATQARVRCRAVGAALAPWQRAIAAGLAKAHAPVGARPRAAPACQKPMHQFPAPPTPVRQRRAASAKPPRAPRRRTPGARRRRARSPCTNSRRRRARRRRPPGEAPCTSRRTPGARRRRARSPCTNSRRRRPRRCRPPGEAPCTSRRTPAARRRRARSPCTNSRRRRARRCRPPGKAPCTSRRTPGARRRRARSPCTNSRRRRPRRRRPRRPPARSTGSGLARRRHDKLAPHATRPAVNRHPNLGRRRH